MLKNSLFAISISVICTVSAYSQSTEDSTYLNTIKINTAALLFNNISIQFERQINEHWSFQMGSGYKWGGGIPKILGLGSFVVASKTGGLRGYSFTPEARYYFKPCECPGERSGLYGGVYSRYTRLYGDLSVHYWNGDQYMDVGATGAMQEMGIGLQLGYQLVIKKRFVIDLMFMGPRRSFQKLNFEVDSDFAEDIIPLLEEEINKRLDYLGMDPISIPVSGSAEVKFGFSNFRYGIGIGYMF